MGKSMTLVDSYIVQNDGRPERLAALFDITEDREVRHLFDSGVKCSDDVIAHLLGFDALEMDETHEVVEEVHGIKDSPHVMRMHLGGNWVVLFWSDGKVTKLQPHPDDEFDTLTGVIAQAYRKIGRNRVSYAKYDPVTEALIAGGYTPDDLRLISRVLDVTAEAMECDGFDAEYKPSDGQE